MFFNNTTFQVKLSKNNTFTIPASLVRQMGWNAGQVINIKKEGNMLNAQSTSDILGEVDDIVSKYKLPNSSPQEAIEYTKKHLQDQKYKDND
jgi:bifunctional DNA-binding transcriptional regulator/antitoxin component of YhaV-PrlF toxin-antitoxin module